MPITQKSISFNLQMKRKREWRERSSHAILLDVRVPSHTYVLAKPLNGLIELKWMEWKQTVCVWFGLGLWIYISIFLFYDCFAQLNTIYLWCLLVCGRRRISIQSSSSWKYEFFFTSENGELKCCFSWQFYVAFDSVVMATHRHICVHSIWPASFVQIPFHLIQRKFNIRFMMADGGGALIGCVLYESTSSCHECGV